MAEGGDTGVDNMTFDLRPDADADHEFLWRVASTTMSGYVEAIMGWDEAWQERRFRRGRQSRHHPARDCQFDPGPRIRRNQALKAASRRSCAASLRKT